MHISSIYVAHINHETHYNSYIQRRRRCLGMPSACLQSALNAGSFSLPSACLEGAADAFGLPSTCLEDRVGELPASTCLAAALKSPFLLSPFCNAFICPPILPVRGRTLSSPSRSRPRIPTFGSLRLAPPVRVIPPVTRLAVPNRGLRHFTSLWRAARTIPVCRRGALQLRWLASHRSTLAQFVRNHEPEIATIDPSSS